MEALFLQVLVVSFLLVLAGFVGREIARRLNLFDSDDSSHQTGIVDLSKPQRISTTKPSSTRSDPLPPIDEDSNRTPHRGKSALGKQSVVICVCAAGFIGLGIWGDDRELQNQFPILKKIFVKKAPATIPIQGGEDFQQVNGIRWFHIVGTDSAGVGYMGWVSEFAFYPNPPEAASDSDIFSAVGLPTIKERMKAIKQRKYIGDSLREALKNAN